MFFTSKVKSIIFKNFTYQGRKLHDNQEWQSFCTLTQKLQYVHMFYFSEIISILGYNQFHTNGDFIYIYLHYHFFLFGFNSPSILTVTHFEPCQ